MTLPIGIYPPTDSSSDATLPSPAPVGPNPGWFSEGSLSSTATIVSADFLNGLLAEILNLATAGGVPLSPSTPTVVANILNLIASQLTGFVKKSGDTMTGNLSVGQNFSGNNATPALIVENGASNLNVVVSAPAAAVNPTTQAGDTLLWYSDGTVNTGALSIAPLGTGTTGGIRLDNTGQATFSRPLILTNGAAVIGGNVTITNGLAVSGATTVPTRPVNDNSTNAATTAFVAGQAASLIPVMDGVAGTGTSITFARQDHVHPTDTSRQALLGFTPVQQGGVAGQTTDKINLGWNSVGQFQLALNGSNVGRVGIWDQPNTWLAANSFSQVLNAGGYNTPGTINASGAIASGSIIQSNGNITAFNGTLRAGSGVFGSLGDANAAPIQFDFQLQPGGIMQFPGWDLNAGVGTGFIFQWMRVTIGPGSQVLNAPTAFPHAMLGVVCTFGYLLPGGAVVGADVANNSQIFFTSFANGAFGVYILMWGY